jgi:hypothetical protein
MNRSAAFKLNHDNPVKNLAALLLLYSVSLASLAQPQEASVSTMQSCRYLDRVEGSSGYGKNFNWRSLAKYSALSQAEKLGASHVVWEQYYPVGAFNGIAIAKAYNCNS